MNSHQVETLIIGAGLIGSSVAMHLAQRGMKNIKVIDFDLEGTLSSSELNAGGVRATWNQQINILMSKNTIDFFSQVAEEVGYRPCGYLWLNSPEKFSHSIRAREKQVSLGWPVEVWDLNELKNKIPFLDKTEGVAGAIFSPRDGLVNPNLLKNYFRDQAKKAGVVFEDRVLITEASYGVDSHSPIRIKGKKWEAAVPHDDKIKTLTDFKMAMGEPNSCREIEFSTKRVINCAGAWASQIAKILGYSSPSYAVRRQICIFDCKEVDLTPYGMIIDTSGVYFHPEATNGLAGFANHDEPPGLNYHYDGDDFFMNIIWPALYERSSYFEKLKHLTGWAGQYEVSPDESAIIGEVKVGLQLEKAQRGRLFEAHSFSGHGVMHSYSAGLGLAELIVKGQYETLDLSELSGERFQTGKTVKETAVI